MSEFKNVIIHGDCLEELKKLPDNSIDAIVTDPPYGLSEEPNIKEVLTKWMEGEVYEHKGTGFMNKEWDSFVPGPHIWKEALRVLKPGGHALVFAGTRTQDLMTTSLRLAGFEIVDVVLWNYFSGFPKSQNIGKLLDKGVRWIVDFEKFRDTCLQALKKEGKSRAELQRLLGNHMLNHYLTKGSQPAIPKYRDFLIMKDYLELEGEYDDYFRPPVERKKIGEKIVQGEKGTAGGYKNGLASLRNAGTNKKRLVDITAPATEIAKKYDGWQTSLKPAHEPIILCRKKNEKPLAQEDSSFMYIYQNISPPEASKKASSKDRNTDWLGRDLKLPAKSKFGEREGRAPFSFQPIPVMKNIHPTVKSTAIMRWLCRLICPPGGVILDPFAGSGSTLVAAKQEGFHYIGIEREAEYVEIIRARVEPEEDVPA